MPSKAAATFMTDAGIPFRAVATVRFGSVAEARLISSTFQGHIKIEANGYPEGVLP